MVWMFAEEAQLQIREEADTVFFFSLEESPFSTKKNEFYKRISFNSRKWQVFEYVTLCLFILFFEKKIETVLLRDILVYVNETVREARIHHEMGGKEGSYNEAGSWINSWVKEWEALPEGFIRQGDWSSYKSDSQVGMIVKVAEVLEEQEIVVYFKKQYTVTPTAKAKTLYHLWKEKPGFSSLLEGVE
jgi:hypothetical protein